MPAALASTATYTFAGFSTTSSASSLTGNGGIIQACNPPSLFAWVRFANVQPPKTFAGSWSGPRGSQSSFNQTETNGTSFFQIQGTDNAGAASPLTPGTYSFALTVDGRVVAQGSFNLNC